MADPITWYALGRDVYDPETIEQAIDAKVLLHNVDPSAHGQENESLYEHRAAELLDHLSYSIYNIKTNPAARIYKAIVGSGLEADFVGIQEAVDWANLYGGGTVFIKAGTYHVPADITLYSHITLLGEDSDRSILYFDNPFNGVLIIGTSGTHKTDIEISNLQISHSFNVDLGALEIEYADDIDINNCYFKDNYDATYSTLADIETAYSVKRLRISNCRFINGAAAFSLNSFDNVVIQGCNIGAMAIANFAVYIGSGNHLVVRECYFDALTYMAFYSDSSPKGVTIIENTFVFSASGNASDAVSFNGVAGLSFINNFVDCSNKRSVGIYLNNCSRVRIENNYFYDAASDGIKLAGSDYCVLNGNICNSCAAYGINISNSASDKNIVTSNMLNNNVSGGLNDAGTGTVSANNVVS